MQDGKEVYMRPVYDNGGSIQQDGDDAIQPEFTDTRSAKMQKALKFKPIGRRYRQPMMGEIMWWPHFNPVWLDAADKKTKDTKHLQVLGDVWKYLNENDREVLAELEAELDDPDSRKWHTLFEEAKKLKRQKLRERDARRARRLRQAQRDAQIAGVSVDEIDFNSDSSGEDSGFEEEELAPLRARRKRVRGASADMPPPSLPGNNRRGRGDGDDSSGSARKRPKPKPRSKKGKNPIGDNDQDDEQHQMSGGLLSRNGYFNNDGRETIMGGVEEISSATSEHSRSSPGMRQFQPTVQSITDDEFDIDIQNFFMDSSTPDAPPTRADSPAGSTASGLFVGQNGSMGESGHGSRPTSRRSGAAGSPIAGLGNGLTGFGARLNTQKTASESSPGHRSRPTSHVQSPTGRLHREGSIFNGNDLTNAGLSEQDAIEQAMRASMAPSEAAVPREIEESPERGRQENQTEHGPEQQAQDRASPVDGERDVSAQPVERAAEQELNNQNPLVGSNQSEPTPAAEQDQPAGSLGHNSSAAEDDDVEDLTGDD